MTSAYRGNGRVLGASLAGTAIEFYDFYIYATAAALVFPKLFFPAEDPGIQMLLSYATMGIAFVARPLGGLVFGHYGDKTGRKSTLVASLMIMGLSTMLIAFLPTYQQAGWVGPLLLCLFRFGQGIGLGGEWGGASLLAVENAPSGWQYRFGMFPPFGAPIGFILANGLFLILTAALTQEQFFAWGWRIPFLASGVLVALGLWIRLKVSETPEFKEMLAKGPPPVAPVKETMTTHGWMVLTATLACVAFFVFFYVGTAFSLGYATTGLHFSLTKALEHMLVAILGLALGIYVAGTSADRFGAKRVMQMGGLLGVPAGFVYAIYFATGDSVPVILSLGFLLFVMGLTYGTAGGWLPSLFPARVRYTGTSIAFNAAGVFGGAVAPLGAQWLVTHYSLNAVGWYLAISSLLSLVALLLVPAPKTDE